MIVASVLTHRMPAPPIENEGDPQADFMVNDHVEPDPNFEYYFFDFWTDFGEE